MPKRKASRNFCPKGKWGRYEGSILRYANGLMVLYSSLGILKPVIKLGNGSSQPIGLKRQGSITPTKPRRRCSLRPLLFPPVDITLIMGEGGSHYSTSSGPGGTSCWKNLTAGSWQLLHGHRHDQERARELAFHSGTLTRWDAGSCMTGNCHERF